jgi:hypothetical protein
LCDRRPRLHALRGAAGHQAEPDRRHGIRATVYTAVEPSDVKAQDLGDAVVLTGSCRISVMSGGRPNSFGVRFTDVYANKGGRWQMVTWQSTRLPE